MAESVWATVAEVGDVTGVTLTTAQIKQAQHALETISGLVVDDVTITKLSARDRRWLRNAVAYQAAFMAPAPDYLERQRVKSAGADGQSATFTADGSELAPLARKALRKLSWRGSRSVHLAAPVVPVDLDDRLGWQPL